MIKNNNLFLMLMIVLYGFSFQIKSSDQRLSNAQLALDEIFKNPEQAIHAIAKCTKDDLNCQLHPYFDQEEYTTIKKTLNLLKNADFRYQKLYKEALICIDKIESKEKQQSSSCIVS